MIVILNLGGVLFQDFEIPEKITGGGAQSLDVKKFIGGARIIDALGSDDDEITWDGRFRGSVAEARCQQLDIMRKQGAPVTLTWSTFSYQVLIKRFKFDYQQPFEIPYSISLEVLLDNNAPPAGILQSLDQVFGTNLSSALDFGSTLSDISDTLGISDLTDELGINATTESQNIASVTTALNTIQNTAATVDSLTGGSIPFLNKLNQNIVSAQGVTQTAISFVNGQLAPVGGSVFGATAGLPVQTIVSNVAGQSVAAAQLANLLPLQSTLGVMSKNLATVGP